MLLQLFIWYLRNEITEVKVFLVVSGYTVYHVDYTTVRT